MIQVVSKITGRVVESINEEDFRIDDEKIYGKDEFGNEVVFLREAFFAIKKSSTCRIIISKKAEQVGPIKLGTSAEGEESKSPLISPGNIKDNGQTSPVCLILPTDEVKDMAAIIRLFITAPKLFKALKQARKTIKILHTLMLRNLPMAGVKRAWQIYQSSPEMTMINQAIDEAEKG